MGNRTSLGNEQYAVNKYIGTAYDHVKNVSENIEDVKIVADALGDDFPEDGLNTIVENVGNINTVVDNIADVNIVADNVLEIEEVADNIDAVLDAPNQAELARKWAQEAEDVEVLPDEYSAYHYSKKSEEQAVIATDAADSIGRYQGLWPDSGGSALKGDTYQTQVSGVPTGQYFTALQNTTVDPVGDDVNWRMVVSEQWVADNFSNTNLLSNHNFLIPSPDDSQPAPSSTPTSYPPGYQIFSGVFANETTGILNLTYIDGRVSFSGGDLYFAVPNTGGLERLTADQFVASVADFDGKPRTRGVSFALVGDEYRVTVGIDALSDGVDDTLLGSVKFEQGKVATGHTINNKIATSVNLTDFLSDGVSFLDSLENAIKFADGLQVIVPYGVYDAGSQPKLIEHPRINIRFEYCEIDFFGLTTNDTNSPLWGGVAIDFNATEYMSIEGDVVFDFNNTYVYRGVRFREREIRKLSGVKAKNIRPPANWKDNNPPLIAGAIVVGAPDNCEISNYGTDNTYKYYQDGTEIQITSSPATPLARGMDVQGTFSNTTLKNGDFTNVMLGLLLDTGTTLDVENTNVMGSLANAIYDLNCTDVSFKGGTLKLCKDQGITLSGRDKRISGFEFDNVEGRMISLHAGNVEGLVVHSNIARSSLISVSSEFVSIRTDAVADTRINVSIRGNIIDVANCGNLFNLGLTDESCSINGNSIVIGQFTGNDPNNGSIVDSEGGVVGFDANNIHYKDVHKFIRCFKGSSTYKNGNNPSNVALSNILADNVQGPIFEVPQQNIEGASCEGEIFGSVNLRLPDNVGVKGLGGAYSLSLADVNTFSTYQSATMGAYGFRWANGNNGDYDTIYEILKPSNSDKTLSAVLRIDEDGVLHLKSGTVIQYDL